MEIKDTSNVNRQSIQPPATQEKEKIQSTTTEAAPGIKAPDVDKGIHTVKDAFTAVIDQAKSFGNLLGKLPETILPDTTTITEKLKELAKPIFPPTPGMIDKITRQTTVDDISKAAEANGAPLTADEKKELETRLNNLSGKELKDEVQFLKEHVINTPNADRAARTYLDLKEMQDKNPTRLTNDLVHTLTAAVGDRRTNATAGAEGIMGQQQALNAAEALTKMPQKDYDSLMQTLDNTGKWGTFNIPWADRQTEKALILKAVGARKDELSNPGIMDRIKNIMGQPSSTMSEIQTYANQIKEHTKNYLIEHSSVLDLDGDGNAEALQQRFTTSCTPTAQQMARAEADPIYAWKLHNEAIHSTADNTDIGAEQKALLEGNGGVADPRDNSVGNGIGMWPENTLNDFVGKYSNKTYTRNDVADTADSRTAALDRMDSLLRRGEDVPICVLWSGGGSHSMVMTDVRGSGDNREYLVSDPWNGETRWIGRQDIVNGNTDFICGNGRLWITYE